METHLPNWRNITMGKTSSAWLISGQCWLSQHTWKRSVNIHNPAWVTLVTFSYFCTKLLIMRCWALAVNFFWLQMTPNLGYMQSVGWNVWDHIDSSDSVANLNLTGINILGFKTNMLNDHYSVYYKSTCHKSKLLVTKYLSREHKKWRTWLWLLFWIVAKINWLNTQLL